MKSFVILLPLLLFLSACTSDICIQGSGFSADDAGGKGNLRISQCDDTNPASINKTIGKLGEGSLEHELSSSDSLINDSFNVSLNEKNITLQVIK